jgi:hypothetical protein
MSKFMGGIKGKEKKEVTSYDADAIAEKLHSVGGPTATMVAPIVEVIETPKIVVKKTSTRTVVDKADIHRLTLDIPKEIMDQMRKDTKRSGQTIKGFIVSLLYDFYERPK